MNHPAMSDGEMAVPSRTIPWQVWALLVGAIVQLGVQIAPDSYQVFGPYFLVDGGMVLTWLQSITPFLLAAAAVLGADRWPAGRRALLVAAAALGVVGVLRLVSDVWWTIWEISPGTIPDGVQPWLTGTYLGASLGTLLAYALLAGGLWSARPDRSIGRTRVTLMSLIALAGVVATGAGAWTVVPTLDYPGSHDYLWVAVVGTLIIAAGFGALAAVALAATRGAPHGRAMPEILIAIGSTVTMIATAWTWCAPYAAPDVAGTPEGFFWVYTIPGTAAVLGSLAMIAGFGLAALAVRRGRVAGSAIA